jgi:hypothetical protein
VPIRPLPPVVTLWDLARGRQIASSWKPLEQLPPAELEIAARAIAEGIAEGRRHGLEMAKADIEEYQASRVGKPPSW